MGYEFNKKFYPQSSLPYKMGGRYTRGSAKSAINNYKETKDADNYSVLLEDPEIDAIVIATPTKTHFSLAKAALEAKKHVFVEKPLATTVIEAQILCQLAKTENLVLMVDHLLLYQLYNLCI